MPYKKKETKNYKCKFNDGGTCVDCSFFMQTIFCGLTKEERLELQNNVVQLEIKRKHNIFEQNSAPSWVYFINEGSVKLTILGEQGKEQIIRLAHKGDVLGYRCVLTGENYRANARAVSNIKLCAVSRSFFTHILENNPVVSRDILNVLANDLGLAEKRMLSLSYKNVRQRIAESILLFSKSYGFLSDGKTIAEPIYRKDIADYAGITIETTIRTLADMRKEGLIGLNGKYMRLEKANIIKEIAESY